MANSLGTKKGIRHCLSFHWPVKWGHLTSLLRKIVLAQDFKFP
jgi:hypothetical protein